MSPICAVLALALQAPPAPPPPAQDPPVNQGKQGEGAPPPDDGTAVERRLDALLDPDLLELFRMSEPSIASGASTVDLNTAAGAGPDEEPYDGGDFVGAPLPFSNPTIGVGVVGVLGYLFRTDPFDDVTPTSLVGLAGFASNNGSWGLGAGTKLHLDRDRWRASFGGAHADVEYDFFGIGNAAGDQNQSIPIRQQMTGIAAELLRQVEEDTYFGGRFALASIEVSLEPGDQGGAIGGAIDATELDADISSLGLHYQRDTRSAEYYPRAGALIDVAADFQHELWGSDFEYGVATTSWNGYYALSEREVLALRGTLRSAFGDVPFFGLSMVGLGSDIRGYTAGRYRDKLLLAAQAEYRREVLARLGLVAFGGLAQVAPDFRDLEYENVLPGGGVGVRYLLSKEHHINLRLDFAWGRDSDAIYFGIGEAF